MKSKFMWLIEYSPCGGPSETLNGVWESELQAQLMIIYLKKHGPEAEYFPDAYYSTKKIILNPSIEEINLL